MNHSATTSSPCQVKKEQERTKAAIQQLRLQFNKGSCRGSREGHFLNEEQCQPVAAVAQYLLLWQRRCPVCPSRLTASPASGRRPIRARGLRRASCTPTNCTHSALCIGPLSLPAHRLTYFSSSDEPLNVGVATGGTRKWNSGLPCPLLQPEATRRDPSPPQPPPPPQESLTKQVSGQM